MPRNATTRSLSSKRLVNGGFRYFREAVPRHNVPAINGTQDECVSSIDHYEARAGGLRRGYR